MTRQTRLHRSTLIVLALAMLFTLGRQFLCRTTLAFSGGEAFYGWPRTYQIEKWRSDIHSTIGGPAKTIYQPTETDMVALGVNLTVAFGIMALAGAVTEMAARLKDRLWKKKG